MSRNAHSHMSAARAFEEAREFINATEERDYVKAHTSKAFRRMRLARIEDKRAMLLEGLVADLRD